MAWLKRLQSRFIFPVILGSVVLTDFLLERYGFDPKDSWVFNSYNIMALVLITLELLNPRRADWNYVNKDGVRTRELGVEIFFFIFGAMWAAQVIYPFSSWVGEGIRHYFGIQNAIGLPWLLQGVIIVLLVDLFRYWIHRFQHKKAFMWRFHALHHLPERLGTLTSTRTHPVDDLMLYIPEAIFLVVVGFDEELIGALFSVLWVISLIKHSNIDIDANWFSKWFQIPRYHLRHHEYQGGEIPTYNYSEILTLWDRVFGTFKGDDLATDHRVGVTTTKPRTFVREFFGSFYLKTDDL